MMNSYQHNGLIWSSQRTSQFPLEDRLGFLPTFLSTKDKRPAREQFAANYVYGGWQPNPKMTFDPETETLHFPGDPPLHQLARTALRSETILLFRHDWVVIVQPDKSYEVARMD